MMWLSPKFWAAVTLAAGLAISHWWAFSLGQDRIQAKWERDVAQRTTLALKAEQAARARERELVVQRTELEKRYADEKRRAAVAASGAATELDRLRSQIRAFAGRSTCSDPSAPGGANGAVIASELLGECAAAFVGMGKEADRLKALVGGLQDYVRNVCRN